MKTKNLVLMALLVGVGAALYMVVPGFIGGMKPDFMLTMMFIGILLFPYAKETFLLSLATGVLSGLFTTFPGGLVPNIIDKAITGLVFLGAVTVLAKVVQHTFVQLALIVAGTIVSGAIFLGTALFVFQANVPVGFAALFVGVVLPATAFNAIAFAVIYPIITNLVKRSSFKTAATHA
ncbi:putative tryptophan transport protein [Metalysinibacillus saudimassiliensis]|uniref:Putative tryptophan transport protein n=1 Tax=Metalysinibacillus saudimassiliensis TaxID=1461583 RepID=A0A078MC64_9BACL|nr:putative tryptophan transport protein [Metalysinibacillus saudimassiliensis]